MWKQSPQLAESYKAGMFSAAPGARGIAPPNLHTESQSKHLYYKAYLSKLDYCNYF